MSPCSMNQINLIRQTLRPHLSWHGARVAFLALFLVALVRVRTVNFVELAHLPRNLPQTILSIDRPANISLRATNRHLPRNPPQTILSIDHPANISLRATNRHLPRNPPQTILSIDRPASILPQSTN
jgi:hypothetical protein